MTAKEAHDILITKFNSFEVVKCFEFEKLYTFQIVPINSEKREITDELLEGTWSVNKETREIHSFHPFNMSVEEYRRGKEVKRFR